MNSYRYSPTLRNAALLRQEAQCQARYRRNVFVTGLVLGMLVTVGLLFALRKHHNDANATQAAAVQAHVSSNPLLQYAHAETGAAPPDSSSPEDQSPQF